MVIVNTSNNNSKISKDLAFKICQTRVTALGTLTPMQLWVYV